MERLETTNIRGLTTSTEGAGGYFVAWEDAQASAHALAVDDHLSCFVMSDIYADIYRYAIINTGATRSMAGLEQTTWLQDQVIRQSGFRSQPD